MRKLLFIFLLLLTACSRASVTEKAIYNLPDSGEIYIGVAYPKELRGNDVYLNEGISLALNTINAEGGVLGKKLCVAVRDDKNDANLGMQIAQTFYEQGITAVIGHWSTNVCYYTEDVYEKNKVVMLTPRASGMNIFDSEYDYIFRMCGNNETYAHTIVSYLSEKSYKRAAILYSDDEYGSDFAEILEKELNARRIMVIDRVTSVTPVNLDSVMQRWNAFGCDCIIIAASFPLYIEPIELLREAGCKIPVFGADNLDYAKTSAIAENGISEIYKVYIKPDNLEQGFLNSFVLQYGHYPDLAAAVGYDAVFLLKDAIESVGSVDGTAIARYLSELTGYKTVCGERSYNIETREFDGFDVEVIKIN